MSNPNDAIRDAILRHLYDVSRKAKSPKSAAIKISDLQRAMKQAHGYKQQEVGGNVDYLIQKGWVVQITEDRTFQTKHGTTQPSERVTYKISHVGIDHLEGASTYQRPDLGGQVNITNINGVTVFGDGNVVNTTFADLSRHLAELRTAVVANSDLTDDAKLNVASDIDTIQSQLQKPTPDRSIIQRAWSAIENAVTVGELAELTAKAAPLIASLVS